EKYHKILKGKAGKFKKSFSLNLTFDEKIAHRIYAACDGFLMPSRFEPCGLSQMISYKYGTAPIVHHTGGLKDTVVDVTESGGGYVLDNYSSESLIKAVDKCAAMFKNEKKQTALMKKIMGYNFSWDETAKKYMDMYKRAQTVK
ncbi:MAG: glycosyltransferase, partial [Candidatus Omnitrophota bacterium]